MQSKAGLLVENERGSFLSGILAIELFLNGVYSLVGLVCRRSIMWIQG